MITVCKCPWAKSLSMTVALNVTHNLKTKIILTTHKCFGLGHLNKSRVKNPRTDWPDTLGSPQTHRWILNNFPDWTTRWGRWSRPAFWRNLRKFWKLTNYGMNSYARPDVRYNRESFFQNVNKVCFDFWRLDWPTEDTLSRVSIMPDRPTWPCLAGLNFNSCSKKISAYSNGDW
jgi:hypothetical protein